MIQLSELFNLVGTNSFPDMASKLISLNCTANVAIPVYDIFTITMHSISDLELLGIAESIQEFNILRLLGYNCGGVYASMGMIGYDSLSLLNMLMLTIPLRGSSIFIKTNQALSHLIDDIALIKIQEILPIQVYNTDDILNYLLNTITNNLCNTGVSIYQWEFIHDYYSMLENTGELNQFIMFRKMNNGKVF